MEFVAIDLETANADVSSICQVGMARYMKGELVHEWKTYVDPQDYFDGMNIAVHGITEDTVMGAPTFPEVAPAIHEALDMRITVCHSHFDRVALHRACERHGLGLPSCTWLDSARVARRAWREQFAQKGYGLANVCASLGYDFSHHDALEDAKAAGHIILKAIEASSLSLDDWLKRVEQPISPEAGDRHHTRKGNVEGPLYGEVLVFTGSLQVPRREAADRAALAGCDVASAVNKKTTILVVGDQDVRKLAGEQKSSKHRKAEDLIAKGQQIRIIRESDFLSISG